MILLRWELNYVDPAQASYVEVKCGEVSIWTNYPFMRKCLYLRMKDPRKMVIDNHTMATHVFETKPRLDCQYRLHGQYPPCYPEHQGPTPRLDPKPLHDAWGIMWVRNTELRFDGRQYDKANRCSVLWASMSIAKGTGPDWRETIKNYQEVRRGLWTTRFFGQTVGEFLARRKYRTLVRETMECLRNPGYRPDVV